MVKMLKSCFKIKVALFRVDCPSVVVSRVCREAAGVLILTSLHILVFFFFIYF